MSHYQYGTMVGDFETGGLVSPGDCVLVRSFSSVAVDTLQDGEDMPVLAFQIEGRINKTGDTVAVVLMLPFMTAGEIAGHLAAAADRLAESAPSASQDFRIGFVIEREGQSTA